MAKEVLTIEDIVSAKRKALYVAEIYIGLNYGFLNQVLRNVESRIQENSTLAWENTKKEFGEVGFNAKRVEFNQVACKNMQINNETAKKVVGDLKAFKNGKLEDIVCASKIIAAASRDTACMLEKYSQKYISGEFSAKKQLEYLIVLNIVKNQLKDFKKLFAEFREECINRKQTINQKALAVDGLFVK